MNASPISTRPLLISALALALASQGGCAWTRDKLGMDAKYQESVQNQPLEVPPGLDAPSTAAGIAIPSVSPNPNATVARPAAGISSFTMADGIDSAYRRLGLALGKLPGVTVGNAAKALNSYEVVYEGVTMLVRAEAAGDQTRVTALGPDGKPLDTAVSNQLLGQLKARLG